MNKVLRTVFSIFGLVAAVFAYAIISQEVKAYQAANDEAEEEVTFDVNNGSVNVALVDVYETVGDGEAVEKPAYRAGGSRKGKLVLTVPAGTPSFSFTAATPKGTPDQKLIVSAGGQVVATFTVKANEGFTGYAPYEVKFADAAAKAASSFSVRVPDEKQDLTFELELTNRVMLWDVQLGTTAITSGKYFFRNIATGKFWGAGNDWGTHASLVDNPEFMTLQLLEDGTYTLETNVNNGGTQYYFNGAWMDNGNPLPLTIEEHEGYCTISDGNIYFGYNGNNTYMDNEGSCTSTNPEDENVKWEIIAEADAPAYLAAATADAPVNATFLVQDANFGRNNRNVGAWVVSEDCTNKNLSGGNNINNNAESYHSVFTVSQTIEGVPNGVYGLMAQGFYRQDGDDNDNLPVFFINDEQTVFPLKTGSENSMSDASVSFSAGKYAIDMLVVEVTDGKITLGTKLENNTALWCIWDNFTLYYYGTDADIDVIKFSALQEQLATLVASASAIQLEDIPAVYAENLANALAAAENPSTTAEYKAAIEALETAINNANNAVAAAEALDAMKAEMDATNVYTAEAYEAYKAVYDNALAQFEAGEAVTVENPRAQMGWHAANSIDDLLLSAWTINDVQCQDYNTSLYINTWSVEGNTDGSEFRVPFFEYWTDDATSLGATTLTATVPGLAAGNYDVTVWARVRIKNGAEAPTYGITMDVNGGEAVDLCAGENVPATPFYLAEFTAKGTVADDGVLKVNIKVAEDNNVSWLSFKNVTYAAQAAPDPLEVGYENAMAVLKDGQTYRIYTELGDAKYYLNETGYLVDNAGEAATLTFSKVAGDAFDYGFKMLGVCYTNPETQGQTTFENDGHIHTNAGQNRNNWEGQVFFLNSEGKYAVRSTNADNPAWGSNTYWDVFEGAELPEAGYSLEPAYVWNVEEFVDVRPAALEKIGNWMAQLQQYTGLVQDGSMYTSNAKDPAEGSYEALVDGDYATFFHSTWHASNDPGEDHYLQVELAEPVSEFYFFFKKRSQNNNNRPTQIDITAGDDEIFGLDDITSITEGLPTDASVVSYMSEKISMESAASIIRFTIPSTNNGAKTGDHVFFTFSEFYILPASDLLNEILESGLLDVTSYKELDEEAIAKIEAIDKKFQALAAQQAYEDAMAVLKDGETYRVTTDYKGEKFYLTTTGYLTNDEDAAATFKFKKATGTEYEVSFKLAESYFTNPDLSGNDAVLNSGHINTNSSARDNWEAQVFFLKDGKYAVRATAAAGGESSWALTAKTFWTVNEGEEGPLAEYSFDMNYVWNVEPFVDNRIAAYDIVKTWNKKMGLVKDASMFSSNAVEPSEGSLENLLDGEYSTFFHSQWSGTGPEEDHYLQAEIENPVSSFIFFFMKRHNNNNNRPTEIIIEGTDDEIFGFDEIGSITEGLPTDESEIYYVSPAILMPGNYQYIRFTIPSTNNGAGNNGHVFFTFSEFNLFPAHPTVQEVLESGYMFMTSASQLNFSDVPVIEELDQKIDAMNATISSSSPMVDAIDVATSDANDAKAIFDLSGRRIAKTTKGVFIVNGKKVVK